MPTTICGFNFYSTATEGSFPTCAQIDENFDSLIALAGAFCAGVTQVYFTSHASTLLNIPAGNLPTGTPNKIKVYVNGKREYDSALIGSGAYTVTSASLITLGYTPSPAAEILVEYYPDSF